MPKTQAALLRLRAIRPDGDFMPAEQFYLPDNSTFLFEWQPDYVIDAIDTVTAKLHLAGACAAHGVPLLMCLGTGQPARPVGAARRAISPIQPAAAAGSRA